MILGDDGGNARPEIDNRQEDDAVNTVGRRDGRHRLRAEAVHEVLQQQTAKGADARLYHGGKAHPRALRQHRPVERPPVKAKAQQGIFLHRVSHQEDRHCRLGNRRCGGGSLHAPTKGSDKEDVQPHIHGGGDEDRQKGSAAVPNAPQSGGIDIVNGQKGNAGKDNPQIALRQVHRVRRGAHQVQHRSGQPRARRREQDKDGAQRHGKGRKQLGQKACVPAAEPLRKQDGQPQRKAGDRHQIKIDHRAGRTDGRQRQLALHIADDEGVRPVVQLLQYAAENQGQTEFDQRGRRPHRSFLFRNAHAFTSKTESNTKNTVCNSLAYGRCSPG